MNWMLTKEGQTYFSKSQGVPTLRNDIDEDWLKYPELRHGSAVKVFNTIPDAVNLNDAVKFAVGIWGSR